MYITPIVSGCQLNVFEYICNEGNYPKLVSECLLQCLDKIIDPNYYMSAPEHLEYKVNDLNCHLDAPELYWHEVIIHTITTVNF